MARLNCRTSSGNSATMKSITISHLDWGVCSTQFQPHRHWEPVEQLLGLRAILKNCQCSLNRENYNVGGGDFFRLKLQAHNIAQIGKPPR